MSRRLVAALAVRNNGTRLYGKPLQNLAGETTILAQLVASLRTHECVAECVLGVAEGASNLVYFDVARQLDAPYVFGSEHDVLGRLLACARHAGATDVLRKTTEDPFLDHDALDRAWERHVARGSDATVLDHAPEGAAFEIFTVAALERAHLEGSDSDREHIGNYPRFHQDRFAIDILEPEPACRRPDLRLTVDQPQDLVVAREVYSHLQDRAPRIPLTEVVAFLDGRPDLRELVAPFADPAPVWDGVPQRED
jgi:spore coat polysaccharide biosynthesis protein SpsF